MKNKNKNNVLEKVINFNIINTKEIKNIKEIDNKKEGKYFKHEKNLRTNLKKEIYSKNDILKLKKNVNFKLTININNEFKNIVKTNDLIKKNEVNIVNITKDGNCFYRAVAFFY